MTILEGVVLCSCCCSRCPISAGGSSDRACSPAARHLPRWFARRVDTDSGAHLLTAPMVTIAAGADQRAPAWTPASNLSLTLAAAFSRAATGATLAESEPTIAAPEAWDHAGVRTSPDRADSHLAAADEAQRKGA